jgi:chitin synthase
MDYLSEDDLFESDVPMTERPRHRHSAVNGGGGGSGGSSGGGGGATASISSPGFGQYDYQPYEPQGYPVLPEPLYAGSAAAGGAASAASGPFGEAPLTPRPKGVLFKEQPPEYPPLAYSPKRAGYGIERVDTYEMERAPGGAFGPPLRPYLQVLNFQGDDYIVNEMEDAELDPFGDDDSLFLETGEDVVRRRTTRRVRGGKGSDKGGFGGPDGSGGPEGSGGPGPDDAASDDSYLGFDDEDFRPRLNYTKTMKKVSLVHGNYVIDAPAPRALLDTYARGDGGREMLYMRYSAATCGPLNFVRFQYGLRQALYSPPRATEIMVCVTMYNEDELLLARTLMGVFANIKNLSLRVDPVWGDGAWKKVVVVIVVDGRVNLHARAEQLLVALGVYQDGYAKLRVDERDVKAHVFEYTLTVGIESVNDRVHLAPNLTPVQFLFCLKERNARKINSHRWCLQLFAPILRPRVVMLLDCGTQPLKDAFFHLWRAFKDENVAGACGEMRALLGPLRKLLANPLVAAQNFEYKISNILDKPMELVFGFILVLPGAFSAYRYEALLNVDGHGPLEKYFKGEFLHQEEADGADDERKLKEKNYREAGIFTSNMYLAEDRILCFELVAKPGHKYVLRYVQEAKAETDVPERIDEFVLQRRRWLNGLFFAAGYALVHWSKIWRLQHLLGRKLFLQLEFYYQAITLLVLWFLLACFFLVFRILTENLGARDMHFGAGAYLAVILLWVYAGLVVVTFVLAFGNTPRGTRRFYVVIAACFAVLMAYLMFLAVYLAVHTVQLIIKDNPDFNAGMVFTNSKFRDLIVSVLLTYTLYFVAAVLYGEPSFMLLLFVQYILLLPTYVNVLNIYAFANIHDVLWGTKDVPVSKDLGLAKTVGKNKAEAVLVAPGDRAEVDEAYYATLESLRHAEPPQRAPLLQRAKDDLYYAFIRTVTILVWMLTNAIVVVVVLNTAGLDTFTGVDRAQQTMNKHAQTFLLIILWIVAGLAAFRFVGCVLYLVFSGFRPLKWRWRARHRKHEEVV